MLAQKQFRMSAIKTTVSEAYLTDCLFVCSVTKKKLTYNEVALVLSAGKNPARSYITTNTDPYEPGNTFQYYITVIL